MSVSLVDREADADVRTLAQVSRAVRMHDQIPLFQYGGIDQGELQGAKGDISSGRHRGVLMANSGDADFGRGIIDERLSCLLFVLSKVAEAINTSSESTFLDKAPRERGMAFCPSL